MSRPISSVPSGCPGVPTPTGRPSGPRPSAYVVYGSPNSGAASTNTSTAVKIPIPSHSVRSDRRSRTRLREPEAVVVRAVDTAVVEVLHLRQVDAHQPVRRLQEDVHGVVADDLLDLREERVAGLLVRGAPGLRRQLVDLRVRVVGVVRRPVRLVVLEEVDHRRVDRVVEREPGVALVVER